MKIEMSSTKDAELWSLQKQDILSALNTQIGKDILRPNFTSWMELTNYDQMLSWTEKSLDSLSNGLKK